MTMFEKMNKINENEEAAKMADILLAGERESGSKLNFAELIDTVYNMYFNK